MISRSSRVAEPCIKAELGKLGGSSSQRGKVVEGEEADNGVTFAHKPRLADTTPSEIEAIMYGSGVSVRGKEFKGDKWYASAGGAGDVFSYFTIIGASITPPNYTSREVTLDTLAVAFPEGKAVTRNCVINYGGLRRKTSGDATSGGLRALYYMKGFCKRNTWVSVVLGGPGARDNDSRLSSYFNIDKKGFLIGLSGDLDCIPAATVNII